MTSAASSAADMAALSTRERILAEALQSVCREWLWRRLDARTGAPGGGTGKQPLQSLRGQGGDPGSHRERVWPGEFGKPAGRAALPATEPATGRVLPPVCARSRRAMVGPARAPVPEGDHRGTKSRAGHSRQIRRSVLFARAAPDDGLFPRICARRLDLDDGSARDGADVVGGPDLHSPRTLCDGRRSRRRKPGSSRRSITSSHSSCRCWRRRTIRTRWRQSRATRRKTENPTRKKRG